jgi:arginase
MQVCFLGAPMDLGADRRGVDIGASAIRYAGLQDALQKLGYLVHDTGNITVAQPESRPAGNSHLKYLEPIVHASEELAALVTEALQKARSPWC